MSNDDLDVGNAKFMDFGEASSQVQQECETTDGYGQDFDWQIWCSSSG